MSYIRFLFKLEKENKMVEEYLKECTLCPHSCKVNRLEKCFGRCKAGINVKIGLVQVHKFEEPCISGENGSGTVFFTGCNLSCVFCQNYKISQEYKGKEISINELAEEFLNLQKQKVNNINLVTGFMYVPQIIEAIKVAKNNGLNIPIVYNTSGYESVETLKMLEGYVDIYLPDFKYFYNELGREYSKVNNYFEVTTDAIKEMLRQVPENIFDENGIMKKGIIIRHLVLPNHIRNSKRVLKYIKDNFGKDTWISVMAQYFPSNKANEYENINRKLNDEEYNSILEYLDILGLENGFVQDLEDEEEKYVPKF